MNRLVAVTAVAVAATLLVPASAGAIIRLERITALLAQSEKLGSVHEQDGEYHIDENDESAGAGE